MLKICALNESSSETDSDNEQVNLRLENQELSIDARLCLDSGGDEGGPGGRAAGPLQRRPQAHDGEQEGGGAGDVCQDHAERHVHLGRGQ